jgi:hypothetical protein
MPLVYHHNTDGASLVPLLPYKHATKVAKNLLASPKSPKYFLQLPDYQYAIIKIKDFNCQFPKSGKKRQSLLTGFLMAGNITLSLLCN